MINDKEKSYLEKAGAFEYYKFVTEYQFYIEGVDTRFGVKIYETNFGKFKFRQSHYCKTPVQAGPYHTSRSTEDTLEMALHSALDALFSFYHSAISAGHSPSDEWFVPNPRF